MNVKLTDAQLRYKDLLKLEYGRYYPLIDWISSDDADRLNRQRKELLKKLKPVVESGCNGTKPDVSKLSPGCRLCAAGQWSCLFINGRCNANCFYCPAPQDDKQAVPQSNGLEFGTPEAYVRYIKQFGFKGISLSGGEPFLDFERSLTYLKAAKEAFGASVHVWLYTNGILATREKLIALRDAGLDEIRFDVGAVNYDLTQLRLAVGVIPVVTVEIPAVPDEYERLKMLVREMADAGVDYLNLHQMRMTRHNMPGFIERGLELSHGKRPTVPRSEITALKLMLYVKTEGIDLPVNYCSFAFKDRYQHAAARFRHAKIIKEDYEDVTSNAYIRSMALQGNGGDIQKAVRCLREERPGWEWYFEENSKRLFVTRTALESLSYTEGLRLYVGYHNTRIRREHDLSLAGRRVQLDTENSVYIERRPDGPETEIPSGEIPDFRQLIASGFKKNNFDPDRYEQWYPLIYHEFIEQGLPDYY
ncbi:MAG TPA: radical SAM protein [Bacteroidales bacterium]|nr:radical SAM protein [Bacteroidales bacterium]